MPGYDDDLRLAHVLADAIERPALENFGAMDQAVTQGFDGRLRSEAGARVEQALRHQLGRTRPRDRVEGRYHEPTGQGDRTWVVDAIDGTANYVRGVPAWATLISLLVEGRPVLGLIAAPSLSRRWWAGEGSGAWTGRTLARARRVQVSETSVLSHASVSADDVGSWVAGAGGPGFGRLASLAWRTRAYGDFWSHALLAEGAVDVALTAAADRYQLSTWLPLVAEAGGTLTDPSGGPVTDLPDVEGAVLPVVASNGVVHGEILGALAAGGTHDSGHGGGVPVPGDGDSEPGPTDPTSPSDQTDPDLRDDEPEFVEGFTDRIIPGAQG